MSPPPALRRTARRAGACLLVTLGVSGCRDSGMDPTATLETEETRAALHLNGTLPSLPDLAAHERVEDRIASSVGQWVASWEMDPEGGLRLRRLAYEGAIPELARALGTLGVQRAVDDVRAALDATSALDAARLPAAMATRLERARALYGDALEGLAGGDAARALHRALEASDVFREVGPHGVALALLAQAEGALARAVDGGALSKEDVERTERLVRGARQALDEEDFPRAIQRAYYACQLMGVDV